MAVSPRTPRIITLLTDFGTRDEYAACLKGVILGLNPQAVLVDLSHEVPPQDIQAGAFVLAAVGPATLTKLHRTYGETAPGEVLALVGSHGFLEIACARSSAAARLRAVVGRSLEIRRQ